MPGKSLAKFLNSDLLLARRKHHDQLTAFELRKLLDYSHRLEVRLHAFKQADAEFLVGHFTATESQRHLCLVAFLEEAGQVAQLDLVIALVRTGTELDFLDLYLLLLLLGFGGALGFLILELAEVHQAADGRLCERRYLDQINPGLFGQRERLSRGHDAKLLSFFTDKTYFRGVDFRIEALRFLLTDARTPEA